MRDTPGSRGRGAPRKYVAGVTAGSVLTPPPPTPDLIEPNTATHHKAEDMRSRNLDHGRAIKNSTFYGRDIIFIFTAPWEGGEWGDLWGGILRKLSHAGV